MARRKDKDRRPADAAPRRTGLPAESSVIAEKTFISPKGRVFRILRTNETDPKDPDQPPPASRKATRRPTDK